jgi:hypothetical protein
MQNITINKRWKLNETILKDESVKEGIEVICNKIHEKKKKFGKMWYDFFIEEVIAFLKKKCKEKSEDKNKEKKELFLELENFNKKKFNSKEEYVNKKLELNEKNRKLL